MRYEDWKIKVDNMLIREVGLSSDHLPDQCWYDMYEDFEPNIPSYDDVVDYFGPIEEW